MKSSSVTALPALAAYLAHCDSDLYLTTVDPAFAQQMALPAEAAGRSAVDLLTTPGSAAAVWLAALLQVRATGQAVGVTLPDPAAEFHWELEVLPQRIGSHLAGLVSVLRNVQHRRQTESDLARVTDHLESFVYTAAHDLQAPVSNLKVLLHLLLENRHEPDSELLLGHMQQSVQQLNTTIAGLVEVLEVQSTFRVLVQELEPAAVCAEVLHELLESCSAEPMQADTDFAALPRVHYSRHYLRSIFYNLLGNARKYRAAERPLHIHVRGWREAGFAVVSVQDNGPGIDLERFGQKLFQPFSRLDTGTEGKGLGLYLVQNMLQRNGGRIEVTSQPGVGTTFTCYLREYERNDFANQN